MSTAKEQNVEHVNEETSSTWFKSIMKPQDMKFVEISTTDKRAIQNKIVGE